MGTRCKRLLAPIKRDIPPPLFETTSLCDESLVLIRSTERGGRGLEKCLLRWGELIKRCVVDSIIAENNLNRSLTKLKLIRDRMIWRGDTVIILKKKEKTIGKIDQL